MKTTLSISYNNIYNRPKIQILPTIYENELYNMTYDIHSEIYTYPIIYELINKPIPKKPLYKKLIPYFDLYQIHKKK